MLAALAHFAVSGVAVGAVGLLAHSVSWVLLASAVGPTAYVFAVRSTTGADELPTALVGHGVAVAVGLATVAALGLWSQPLTPGRHPDLRHVGSAALTVGLTTALLDLLDRHHAPAAATAMLVGGVLVAPGQPVVELVVALVAVSVVAAAVTRLVHLRR